MNRSMQLKLLPLIQRTAQRRGFIFGGIILIALMAFEVFNYSSTRFALGDILGELAFGPFKWATILAFAFCGIDFAGIARIFTPETGRNEPAEVWYLFAAWFLAAAFNARLHHTTALASVQSRPQSSGLQDLERPPRTRVSKSDTRC